MPGMGFTFDSTSGANNSTPPNNMTGSQPYGSSAYAGGYWAGPGQANTTSSAPSSLTATTWEPYAHSIPAPIGPAGSLMYASQHAQALLAQQPQHQQQPQAQIISEYSAGIQIPGQDLHMRRTTSPVAFGPHSAPSAFVEHLSSRISPGPVPARYEAPLPAAFAPESATPNNALNTATTFNPPHYLDYFLRLSVADQQNELQNLQYKIEQPRFTELYQIFYQNLQTQTSGQAIPPYGETLSGTGSPDAYMVENDEDVPAESFDDESQASNQARKRGRKKSGSKAKKDIRERIASHGLLPCKDCDKLFADGTKLRKHSYTHREKREFCELCESVFHTKKDLKRHQDTVHARGRSTGYVCTREGCERGRVKPFSRKDNAKQHVVSVHRLSGEEAIAALEEVELDGHDVEMGDAQSEEAVSPPPDALPTQTPVAAMVPSQVTRSASGKNEAFINMRKAVLQKNAVVTRKNSDLEDSSSGNPLEFENWADWLTNLSDTGSERAPSLEPETFSAVNNAAKPLTPQQQYLLAQLVQKTGIYGHDSKPRLSSQFRTMTFPPTGFPSTDFR